MASLPGVVEAPHVLLRDVKGHRQEGGDGKNRFSSKIQSIALLLGFSKLGLAFLMSCRNSAMVRQQEISVAVN